MKFSQPVQKSLNYLFNLYIYRLRPLMGALGLNCGGVILLLYPDRDAASSRSDSLRDRDLNLQGLGLQRIVDAVSSGGALD